MTRRTKRASVVILGTGGTIAGLAEEGAALTYRPGAVPIRDLVEGVPGLASLAEVRSEQLFQIDSANLGDDQMITLARRLNELAAMNEVDAIVVAHGTDTIEESAYFAHLTTRTAKPIVFVGSMRPASAVGADGPANLLGSPRGDEQPDPQCPRRRQDQQRPVRRDRIRLRAARRRLCR